MDDLPVSSGILDDGGANPIIVLGHVLSEEEKEVYAKEHNCTFVRGPLASVVHVDRPTREGVFYEIRYND